MLPKPEMMRPRAGQRMLETPVAAGALAVLLSSIVTTDDDVDDCVSGTVVTELVTIGSTVVLAAAVVAAPAMPGMISDWPTRTISDERPLVRLIAATLAPVRRAMADSVSPD